MAIQTTMGLKKIIFAPANPSNNTQMPTDGWRDLGDVYKDTCTFVDADPTTTEHISETSLKKIVQKSKGVSTLTLSLMDPKLEMLAEFFGGTITGAVGARKWVESSSPNTKEYAVRVFPHEDLCLNLPAVVITAKKNTTYSSQGITLIELQIVPIVEISYEEGVKIPALKP